MTDRLAELASASEELQVFEDDAIGAAMMNLSYIDGGETGLRAMLAEFINPSPAAIKILLEIDPNYDGEPLLNRTSLIKAAGDLDEMGLTEPARVVAEVAAAIPEPVCPHAPNTGNSRAWHQLRAKKPFGTEEEAEQCLLSMDYRVGDDDLWTNRFGQVESKVLPSGQGFRILSLKAGADWQEYL